MSSLTDVPPPAQVLSEEDLKRFRDGLAGLLEDMAKDIRSGSVHISSVDQTKGFERAYNQLTGKSEFFASMDATIKLTYHNVANRQAEKQRLADYLKENQCVLVDVQK